MQRDLTDYEKDTEKKEEPVKDLDKRFLHYLAGFWSVVSATYIVLVTFIPIPLGNERIVDTLIGFLLGSVISTIITYFFGSSSGSAAKNNLIAERRKD